MCRSGAAASLRVGQDGRRDRPAEERRRFTVVNLRKRGVAGVLTAAAAASLALVVSLGATGASASQTASYPRSQTLITSGTQWGNIAGMNPYVGNNAAGMIGLVNETLLRFDPLKGQYIDWLAQSAKWTGAKQYSIVVRPGVKWSDGRPFTASDVKFNVDLARFNTSRWNNLYTNLQLPIRVKGNTVVFNFKGTPNYVQWQNMIWNMPMISPIQGKTIKSAAQLTTYNPHVPIGTGPYKLDTRGFDVTTRVVWQKRATWWASQQGVAPSPAPKYIIDLVNTSNTNSLAAVLAGVEDLNNNYLPGVNKLVDSGKVKTYFPKAPYMLSANTAWLEPNTTVVPLNDPVFRKALAMSIDINKIVSDDYQHLVVKASPTGLLPTWNTYVNKSLVASYGFKYDPAGAKALLLKAGYKQDSSGMFETKSGAKIDLDISVPQGWSDWEAARDMIIASAKDAGIRLTAKVKDYNTWQSDRNTGKFDLVIDNAYQLSDNPWTYWNGIFHLPVITTGTGQTFANYERYQNQAAWNLTQQLDQTPLSNTKAIKSLNDQLQTVLMKDLPLIPLWYNGIWSQMTSKYWTNWPSSTSANKYIPVMWNGYLQMTGIDTITHIKSTSNLSSAK
jgi:peptide/nickel transport system substrate-binding protein